MIPPTMDVLNRTTDILVEHFDLPREEIEPSTTYDSLDLDSLILMELSIVIQRDFGIEVSEQELMEARSIGATAALIESKTDS